MDIRTADSYKVTKWSGGTTTEVFIYPEHADYAAREFDFRISSATVEEDYSKFTSLPGVTRFISVLTGALELSFNGGEKQRLTPYEVVKFQGDWDTESWGTATDFNLMIKTGTGDMAGMEITSETELHLREGHHVFYVGAGAVTLNDGSETRELKEKESVYLVSDGSEKLFVNGNAKLMHCYVKEV